MGIILVGYDIMDVTFAHFMQALALVIVVYEVWKKLRDIKKESDEDHKRKESWDKAAKVIEEKEKVWDDAVADIRGERKFIIERYDNKLAEIRSEIDDNHTDTEAKLQEVRADISILAEAIRAVLEGQIEQGCNGPVKAAKEKLDHYLIESLGR